MTDTGLLTRKELKEAEEVLWNQLSQRVELIPSEKDRCIAEFLIYHLKYVVHGSAETKRKIADDIIQGA
jgi:hypothetical protein